MAQWIWYPGDFEFFLGLKVASSRTERGMVIVPNWRVESFYHNVRFEKKFYLEKDTYIKIHSTGTQSVTMDLDWYSHYDPAVGVFVPKGEHIIWVHVFNKEELPSIYIDCPGLETDGSWEVTCDHVNRKSVGCWNFTNAKEPPTSFRLATEPIEPEKIITLEDGVLYDFGRETMGFVKGYELSGSGTVLIYYGESREEALDTKECCIFERVKVEEGSGSFYVSRSQAFRYLYIPKVPGLSIGHLSADYEYLPVVNKGAFHSEDRLLNQIYDVSVRTIHLTTREFFIDGIKRDRWVWSGDATQSYLINYYSFFDNDVCKRTMRLIRGKDPVTIHFNTIQDYTLYWFISLYQYYLYTGDRDFMEEMYPAAYSLMENFCLPRTDERGFLMAKPEDWVFIDWADIPDLNKGDISFIQLLLAYALKSLADIADVVGKQEDRERYTDMYQDLWDKIVQTFWSEERGCFTHGPAEKENAIVTRYANIFAVLLGCLEEEKKQRVIASVLCNDEIYAITTPYMKFYELLAFCEAGLFEQTEEYIKSYWGGMLNLGCTSFWEKYNPKNVGAQHAEMYGLKYGVSFCHAWGAGPVLLFGKYYLGVRPTAPGYTCFEVKPHLLGGQEISGKVPVPEGEICVFLNQERVVVENHSKGTGELKIDGRCIEIPAEERVEVCRVCSSHFDVNGVAC